MKDKKAVDLVNGIWKEFILNCPHVIEPLSPSGFIAGYLNEIEPNFKDSALKAFKEYLES